MNSKRENLLRTGIVASNHRTRANVLKKRGFFSPILSFSHKTKFKAPLHGPPKQGCLGSLQELKSRFGEEQRERAPCKHLSDVEA